MSATNAPLQALGLVEVRGLANAIVVADAMVKGSHVRIRAQQRVDPALITIVVEGDVGACEAAVEAGVRVARNLNALVSSLTKGRPDDSLRRMVPVDAGGASDGPGRLGKRPAARAKRSRA